MKAKKYLLEKINQQTIQYNFMQQQKNLTKLWLIAIVISTICRLRLRFFTMVLWGRPDMALYKFTENILLKKN